MGRQRWGISRGTSGGGRSQGTGTPSSLPESGREGGMISWRARKVEREVDREREVGTL